MKITFPHMGTLYIPLKLLLAGLGMEVVVPPPFSKESMNLAVKYSPEGACLPFKLTLANYIQAMAKGADTVLMGQGYGLCRFGFYTEVQERILADLGYKCQMVLINISQNPLKDLLVKLKELSGKSWWKVLKAVYLALTTVKALDNLERALYKVRPREVCPGESTRVYQSVLKRLEKAKSTGEVRRVARTGLKALAAVEQDAARPILKIGILGEFYVVLEPFTSSDIEKRLGEMGVEVTKFLYPGDWVGFHLFLKMFNIFSEHKNAAAAAKPYLGYNVSGDALQTIGQTVICAEEGYDGIIQLYPFTCMPEIVAKHVLPKVSEEHNIPVLSLGLDEHSGNAGFVTRLEAFVDLLGRKKLSCQFPAAK
ncbi:MAG TPA: CoA protein activase [Verrucomicrobiae bacterium]|nr:CoA protein activase [Verrucomicrobiae bacterium]